MAKSQRRERKMMIKGGMGVEAKLTHVDLLVQLIIYDLYQAYDVGMATELHDSNLFFNFVFLATKVIGDGQMRPRAWNPLPLELVEPVGAGVVARHNFDSLREDREGGAQYQHWPGKQAHT
jgi:hypothetical protein